MMTAWLHIHVENILRGDISMIGLKEDPLGMRLSIGGMESLSENPISMCEDGAHKSTIAHFAAPQLSEVQTPMHEGGIRHGKSIEDRCTILVTLFYYNDIERPVKYRCPFISS